MSIVNESLINLTAELDINLAFADMPKFRSKVISNSMCLVEALELWRQGQVTVNSMNSIEGYAFQIAYNAIVPITVTDAQMNAAIDPVIRKVRSGLLAGYLIASHGALDES